MARLSFGSIGLKSFAYTLAFLVILFSTLAIVGCVSTSPGIPHIYVAELNDTTLRFGYLAICSSSFSQDDFQCASTVGKSAAALSTTLSAPEIAIQYLLDLQESISFVIPAISGATFLIGVISFRATTWAANRDSAYLDTFVTTTEVFVWTSVATALTAAYSVTYTVSAIESATIGSSSLAISGGKALEILQWMAFAFSSLFALAVRKLIQDIDDSDLRPILPITKRNQTPVKRSLPPPARAKQAPAKPRMARKDSL